jgi:tetratricopeptide (TPR) repeat protein
MSPKKSSKEDYKSYTSDELFNYFTEALFEHNIDFAEKCIEELIRRVDQNEISSEDEKIKYLKAMGLFQEMINNDEKAREYFLRVLDIKPDDEESITHINRLSGLET